VEGIIFGIPQLTKFLGLGTTSPPCSLMPIDKLELVSNAKGSQERNNSTRCH
jgi:hypothetical protein